MEPRIQYAKTSDGVSIAYWSMGEGLPFVHLPPGYPFTHLKAEWDIPGWLAWCQQLAAYVRLIRLDLRGCGLSDRDVADRSVEKLVVDVEAVVDALGLEQFALAGVLHSGPASIAYAAAHPDRVARLILWCTYSRSEEARSPQADAMRGLLSSDCSRLVLLEGSSLAPWRLADGAAAMSTVAEFLQEGVPPPQTVDLPSGTAVILFADIADSTGMTERLGDAAFREKARELDGALRAAIRERDGTPVEGKLLGDGVLAVFTSARQAIEAALKCADAGGGCGLPLHLGAHAGDVISEEGNVFGGAVNIAARIAAASGPGELLVSQTVRDLARTSAGVAFEDRGQRKLRGVGEPVRMYEVRRRGQN